MPKGASQTRGKPKHLGHGIGFLTSIIMEFFIDFASDTYWLLALRHYLSRRCPSAAASPRIYRS